MADTTTERCVASTLFVGFLALYLALPTRDLYWDGAGFALAVDHPGWFSAIAPNHPLYIGFGRGIHSVAQYVLPGLGGLAVLQGLNAVLGALSVALLYLISHELIADTVDSALLAGIFALSATWWKFTTDANAYILPTFLLLIAARYLLPARKARPLLVAGLHTAAMLFHELAVVFVVPAIVGIYLQSRGNLRIGIRNVIAYLSTALTLTSASYYACFRIASGQASIAAYIGWITYHTPDSSFSFDVTRNAWLTIRGTARLLVGGRLNTFHSGSLIDVGIVIGLSALGIVLLRLVGRAPAPKQPRAVVPLLCSWIVAYTAFLFFWLPQNTFYRLFYFPPLILLAGVLSRKWAGRKALYAVVALLGTWNYVFFIRPHSDIENNLVARSGLAMRAVWKPGAWLYMGAFNSDNWMILCFNPQVRFKNIDIAKLDEAAAELQGFNMAGNETWIDRSGIDLLQSDPAGRRWLAAHTKPGFSKEYVDGKHTISFARLFP